MKGKKLAGLALASMMTLTVGFPQIGLAAENGGEELEPVTIQLWLGGPGKQKDSDKAYYVMEAIVNDSEFEYADSDVQALVDTQKQQYEQYASYFGMSLDDFLSNSGMTDEKLEENARFQIGCTLAIDAIGKAENMTVSDEEYQSGLEELASQYGAESGEAFEEQYGKEDVENSILYDKIMDYVVDQAVVK